MTPTRRQFLAASGAALILAGRRALGEEPELSLALVSDTHLGRQGSPSYAKWMQQVVEEINASPAEMTLFLGDLVDSGAKNEPLYAEWTKIAKGLKKPFYPVPGNHDPDDFFKKHVRPETDYVADHKGHRFVFFQDTRTDSHLGTITPEQLRWITEQVDAAAAKKLRVILCAHITSHKNLHPDVGWWVRTGGEEFRKMLEARSHAVVACFSGHFHCGVRGWSDLAGIPEVVVPSTAWNGNRGLDKAPGFAMEEFRRGYVLADLWPDRLRLRYKPIGAEPSAELTLRLPSGKKG